MRMMLCIIQMLRAKSAHTATNGSCRIDAKRVVLQPTRLIKRLVTGNVQSSHIDRQLVHMMNEEARQHTRCNNLVDVVAMRVDFLNVSYKWVVFQSPFHMPNQRHFLLLIEPSLTA